MRIPALIVVLAAFPTVALAQSDAGPTAAAAPAAASDAALAEQAAAAEPDQPSLEDLLWTARPLVVFADSPNDPRFGQQLAEIEERKAEFEERRVVVLTDTDPAARGPLRRELRPRGFGVVLVDTDGTVVQRRPSVTTSREILNLIDRLPSWRQESGSRRN